MVKLHEVSQKDKQAPYEAQYYAAHGAAHFLYQETPLEINKCCLTTRQFVGFPNPVACMKQISVPSVVRTNR